MTNHLTRMAGALALVLGIPALVTGQLKPDAVPTFQVRARVLSVAGAPPADRKFSLRFDAKGANASTVGDVWSSWLPFGREQVEQNLKGYPALYLKRYPVVVRLVVGGVVDATVVEAELQFDGVEGLTPLRGELFGPRLGVMIWREADGSPRAATMAAYNHRYWKEIDGAGLAAERRPKHFPIVDRFIGGDDDRIAWREGIEHLSQAGFSAIMLPPDAKIRRLLLDVGLHRTSWAVYNPPGYAFDFDPEITDESIREWASKQARGYLDAGYAPTDMALFAMSDEPGWYYPQMFEPLKNSPQALERFRQYLRDQGLTPQDVGAGDWSTVVPLGRSQAKDLPARRLFYWSMRFFPHDSARHFARSTKALEEAFYPGVPVLTNWNFFSGRSYVPGPVANNKEKKSPDAAMGGHDWLEFGRMRGCTMLWTEDWFSDAQAYQWSFYASKLRCAADKGGVQFGGYVIPRTAGDRGDGIVQKILCVVGSGGKALKYFVFGPEYNFPGNCYSEKSQLLPRMAEAHGLIASAEDLLWPGRRPRPQVAILMPRSAQPWDAKDIEIPNQISDATNAHLNRRTVDYMAEVFNLYLALQHRNIPVDFVEEDDMTPQALGPYKVLYVTEPNVPVEGQQGLLAWVRGGGTCVLVSGAASADRYDEPSTVLLDGLGIREKPRSRLPIANTNTLPDVAKGGGRYGEFTAVGARGEITTDRGEVIGTFDDGTAAVVLATVGQGRAIHFAWMPGLSYWKSSRTQADRLPVGFAESIRQWISAATELAKVTVPVEVDRPMIEAPMLLSDKGAAVTLLNWSGTAQAEVAVKVQAPFKVGRIESVRHGELRHVAGDAGVSVRLPLHAVDILRIYPVP